MSDPLVRALSARNRFIRRLFLVSVTASAVLLLPWIVYLALHLPSRYSAAHWNVAWVGFDVALLALLTLTAVAAHQRRQAVVPIAIAAAAFLVTDAWFDVVLDWGTNAVWWSLLSAALLELPLAVFLLMAARRIIHLLVRTAWERGDNAGPPPRLRHVRITQLVDRVVMSRDDSAGDG